MTTGDTPAGEPGWNATSTDRLIELAYGLLCSVKDQAAENEPGPGWLDAFATFTSLYHEWIAQHPEDTCHRCGKPFIGWSAPSPLWNEVMRGGSCAGGPEPYRGIICPSCFMHLAEQAGIATMWRVYATTVFRHLQTVTDDGRVWNPQTWLFEKPAGGMAHGFTPHGHPCCGQAPVGGRPRSVHRCGGATRCGQCAVWAQQIHDGQDAAAAEGPSQ